MWSLRTGEASQENFVKLHVTSLSCSSLPVASPHPETKTRPLTKPCPLSGLAPACSPDPPPTTPCPAHSTKSSWPLCSSLSKPQGLRPAAPSLKEELLPQPFASLSPEVPSGRCSCVPSLENPSGPPHPQDSPWSLHLKFSRC